MECGHLEAKGPGTHGRLPLAGLLSPLPCLEMSVVQEVGAMVGAGGWGWRELEAHCTFSAMLDHFSELFGKTT